MKSEILLSQELNIKFKLNVNHKLKNDCARLTSYARYGR